jgi:hypothetical protein
MSTDVAPTGILKVSLQLFCVSLLFYLVVLRMSRSRYPFTIVEKLFPKSQIENFRLCGNHW